MLNTHKLHSQSRTSKHVNLTRPYQSAETQNDWTWLEAQSNPNKSSLALNE